MSQYFAFFSSGSQGGAEKIPTGMSLLSFILVSVGYSLPFMV